MIIRNALSMFVGPRYVIDSQNEQHEVKTRTRQRTIISGIRRDVAEIISKELNSPSPELSGTLYERRAE